jgi:protein involved in polysaccharide export with SLBB domain
MRRIIALLLVMAVTTVFAGEEKGTAGLKPNMESLLPNDILTITVVNHPELSIDSRISPEGTFEFPYCGSIEVKNKSVISIEKEISDKLAKYDIKRAEASIFVRDASRKIYVFGEVTAPSFVLFNWGRQITVIQAVSAAQGFTEKADIQNISVVRHTEKGEKVFQYNAKTEIAQLNDEAFYLQDGDTVIVRAIRQVSVLGEVRRPGAFYMRGDVPATLSAAIALAGGFDKFANTNVYLKRDNTVKRIDMDDILTSNAEDPLLIPGDTVFVPKTRW